MTDSHPCAPADTGPAASWYQRCAAARAAATRTGFGSASGPAPRRGATVGICRHGWYTVHAVTDPRDHGLPPVLLEDEGRALTAYGAALRARRRAQRHQRARADAAVSNYGLRPLVGRYTRTARVLLTVAAAFAITAGVTAFMPGTVSVVASCVLAALCGILLGAAVGAYGRASNVRGRALAAQRHPAGRGRA